LLKGQGNSGSQLLKVRNPDSGCSRIRVFLGLGYSRIMVLKIKGEGGFGEDVLGFGC